MTIARRKNVTGIPRLSIGITHNDKGSALKRYCVTLPVADSKPITGSFYFGENTSQLAAFQSACAFLKESGEKIGTKKSLLEIYEKYDHESLI